MLKKDQEIEIKEILSNASACIIYTGAGMGVDSGLSVFRGTEGLWEKYPEAGKIGLSFEKLANPNNYQKYPEVVIPFYLDRYKSYKNAEPHSGFYELLGYVSGLKDGYFCVTSNVDGLFQKSTFNKERVYEIHGAIDAWQCSNYNCAKKSGLEGLRYNIEATYNINEIDDFRCEICGDHIRPNICMFYDFNWYSYKHDLQENKYNSFSNKLKERRKKVAIIEIGAGEAIRSIKTESELTAYDLNTKVIRINKYPVKSDLNDPDVITIEMSAAEGVAYIMSLIEEIS